MARPLRIQRAGLTYHVMSRGNGKRTIFLDETDYSTFLSILAEVTGRFDLECWLYCLMRNHYHLALRTRKANLSNAVRHLNGRYAQWWNARHAHVGHVFQGRFKAQIVEAQGYLANLCRYIMLNPVRAGLVDDVAAWPWSSYHALAGRCATPAFLTCAPVLSMYGAASRRTQSQCFRAHVSAGDAAEQEIAALVRRESAVIGSDEFTVQFIGEANAASQEVPRRHRTLEMASLSRLLRRLDTEPLPIVLRMAHVDYHYPITEIAARLGLSVRTARRLIASASGLRPDPIRPVSDLTPTGGTET